MSYKNILNPQMEVYNHIYKLYCKKSPHLSLYEKRMYTIKTMFQLKGLTDDKLVAILAAGGRVNRQDFISELEINAVNHDLEKGIDRYYIKDNSLFDFFTETPVRDKEAQSVLSSFSKERDLDMWGIIGEKEAYTIIRSAVPCGNDCILVLSDFNHYLFVPAEMEDEEKKGPYNLVMNFLFYINAFPECVQDGVPNGVKRNPKAKSVSISDKIVSHTSIERGFVRPHFRSGYFRHLQSDYFVNCKGQVRFISSTMVKGKAKTVIEKK